MMMSPTIRDGREWQVVIMALSLLWGCASSGPEVRSDEEASPMRARSMGPARVNALSSRADTMSAWVPPGMSEVTYVSVVGRSYGGALVVDEAEIDPSAAPRLLAIEDVTSASGLEGLGTGRSPVTGPAEIAAWLALLDYWRHATTEPQGVVLDRGWGKHIHRQQSLDKHTEGGDVGVHQAGIIRETMEFMPHQRMRCRAGLKTFSEYEAVSETPGSVHQGWLDGKSEGAEFQRAASLVRQSKGDLVFQMTGERSGDLSQYGLLLVDVGNVDRDSGSSERTSRVLSCSSPRPLFASQWPGYDLAYERQGDDHVVRVIPAGR